MMNESRVEGSYCWVVLSSATYMNISILRQHQLDDLSEYELPEAEEDR